MSRFLLSTRRRQLVAGVAIVALITTSAAFAQDYIFTNFAAHQEHRLAPAPCVLQGAAAPVVYDTSLWLFYTCTDNQVIAWRFLHATDRTERTTPRPVYLVPNLPSPSPGEPTPAPAPGASCPVGMVSVPQGGCVPPDHPLAGGGR